MMRIYFVSSEAFPFSKTGGLADMAYFLPLGLKSLEHDVKVITPYYKSIGKYHHQMHLIGRKTIHIGGIETIVNYFGLTFENIDYIFIQNMHYFERENLYGYPDDAERFTCFDYATLEVMDLLDEYPDILHINDWQTGMIPYLLDEHYRHKNEGYYGIHTLLTIHNLQYQGSFGTYVSRFFNTPFNYTYMHFDSVNFLKAAISRSTKINTVSPQYRNEVLSMTYGFSLDGALWQRKDDFTGILNGIDDSVFNPKDDPFIEKTYSLKTVVSGKRVNKEAILHHFNLDVNLDAPLIVYVGRLAEQKGIDLIMQSIEHVVHHTDASFILMGSGESNYESFFKSLSHQYPNRIANYIGFNEQIAHQLYAAADLFMMPSQFEPCGLGQMIAMTYGTLPIVRETGGLKDTVIPYNRFTGEGTGFSFAGYEAHELRDKLFEAIYLYHEDKKAFKKLIEQAMNMDFSVHRMASSYVMLYKNILGV